MDKEWIRQTVEKNINTIYGLKKPSDEAVENMAAAMFSQCPVLQFPGYRELNPLFGCLQGAFLLKEHYKAFYRIAEVVNLEKQYIIVDGFQADAHYKMELKFNGSGSRYEFELLFLVDLDAQGRVRSIKLYFDTATFLKALQAKDKRFTDVREALPHPDFNPNFQLPAGAIASAAYLNFGMAYFGLGGKWEDFHDKLSDDVEVVFKSNVDVLPYAGQYSGKEGFKQWLKNLTSLWSLNSFNFTKVYTEGNAADFMMHELHYYNNPDGSKRFLDVYIVQSIRVDNEGKLHLFKSYNDSAWLDETYYASAVYKQHYGYPADYPAGMHAK